MVDNAQQIGDEKHYPGSSTFFQFLPIMPLWETFSGLPGRRQMFLPVIASFSRRLVIWSQGRTGACKVTHLLAAKCCDPKKFITDGLSLALSTKRRKVEESLGKRA